MLSSIMRAAYGTSLVPPSDLHLDLPLPFLFPIALNFNPLFAGALFRR